MEQYSLRASLWWTNVRVCGCKVFGGNEDVFLVWGTMWMVLPIIGDVLTTCTWWGVESETIGRVGGEELESDDVLLYKALSLLSSASLVAILASLSISKSPFILILVVTIRHQQTITQLERYHYYNNFENSLVVFLVTTSGGKSGNSLLKSMWSHLAASSFLRAACFCWAQILSLASFSISCSSSLSLRLNTCKNTFAKTCQ